jgi:regulator of sirC expression with transglutaminase-like and TPR domain
MDDPILHLGLLDDEAIQLDVAALELAALDHIEVDLEPYADILTAIVERLADLGGAASASEARAKILARVIGGEFGFVGDRETYDHPDNADMVRVIDRRRGLPVSLSIIYVAAARRMGWAADALNTPGHVVVRVGEDTAPVLIDPFDGGAIMGAEQLAVLLTQRLGANVPLTSDQLVPMTNRAVLVRLLLNQATRAEAMADASRALTLYARMTDIAPEAGHAWWERARLESARGEVSAARRSLSAMLEMTRDPARREHIAAALTALAEP